MSPELSAVALAKFVKDTKLDGVDVYFTDQKAFVEGIAEEWLIKFTRKLRDLLPLHIISHSPYATFFDDKEYKNGGYTKIHKEVGNLIDFYNVRFYGMGNSKYDQYYSLFYLSGPSGRVGTSLRELTLKGIPAEKIVLAKTTNRKENGFMEFDLLGSYIEQSMTILKWNGGVMIDDFSQDENGQLIMDSAEKMVDPLFVKKIKLLSERKI